MNTTKMTFYATSRTGATCFPLERILMTDKIAAAIRDNGGSTEGKGFKMDPHAAGFGLSRMVDVLAAFNENKRLDPVIVREVKDIDGTTYYSLQDGRHRLACSVIHGYTCIPCIVIF